MDFLKPINVHFAQHDYSYLSEGIFQEFKWVRRAKELIRQGMSLAGVRETLVKEFNVPYPAIIVQQAYKEVLQER